MSLTELASFADIVAAVAIVVSLIFVAIELRLTRKQSELSNWREVLQELTNYKAMTNDPALAQLVVRGHADYHGLDAAEKLSFGLYLEQVVHIYGNFQSHSDSLPRKLVGLEEVLKNMFCEMLQTPGDAVWWAEAHERKRFMPESFKIIDTFLAA